MANMKNLASGVLAESITKYSATILVYVGSGGAYTIKAVWPTAPFYVTVMPSVPTVGVANSLDSEIMLVTSVGTDQVGNVALSVTRAQKSTTAKAFNSGAVVVNGIYADDNNYSASEVATGKIWTDGTSMIYRKTVDCGSLPDASAKNVAHGISNLGAVVSISAAAYNSGNGYSLPLPYTSASPFATASVVIGPTAITISTTWGAGTEGYTSSHVTMEYTKTS